MPSLRIATWNSGGEAGGRGAQLLGAVNFANGTAPPVKLVAIQEAKVSLVPAGSIRAQLTSGAGPFVNFVVPPDHPRELNPPTQPLAVGKNKSYLIGWDPVGPGPVSAAAAARISLVPNAGPPANGVETYINGLPIGVPSKNALRLAARNIRAPVRKPFTLAAGGVACNIFFYTWHAELQANWLGATWATVGLLANPFNGPGMFPAFQFFQNSNQFMADMAALTVNDVIIIAGDLNITGADLGHPAIFPNFVATSNNLSHVLAFSPSGALAIAQGWHHVTPYPPHSIITAEVQW
ncbi:hypothetical protein [Piscinibacter terrae]|uniref:hypothetical protein n=1 Tax=Piscinibacter terrae TaxID=2496871 RepID=UPI000F5AFF43|nr:hypothetical protein [Albitalea terrae]